MGLNWVVLIIIELFFFVIFIERLILKFFFPLFHKFFLEKPLFLFDKSLDDNRQYEIKQEKLAHDDHTEAIEGAHNGNVDVHGVCHHHVPGFTSDHLKDSEKGAAHVIEICDPIVDVGSLIYFIGTFIDLKLLV